MALKKCENCGIIAGATDIACQVCGGPLTSLNKIVSSNTDSSTAKFIFCSECGKKISSKAEICPKCGFKNKDSNKKYLSFPFGIFSFLASAGSLLAWRNIKLAIILQIVSFILISLALKNKRKVLAVISIILLFLSVINDIFFFVAGKLLLSY